MMQFYQKRDFGTLISDTFTFFKQNGKNYFKNYILVTGLLLILMVVLFVLGYRELFSQMFGSNTGGQNYYFQSYFQENQLMLILVTAIIFILFLITSVFAYSYPVLYMKRLSETGNSDIKADDILGDLKKNSGRIVKLLLGLIFVVTPSAIILVGISYVLMLIIIGLFLFLLMMPVLMNVVNFLLFDYFHTNKGFFESLSYAIRAQFSYPNGREKSPFWKYWGSMTVTYMIINVVSTIFTLIPMVIIFSVIFTIPQNNAGNMTQNPLEGTAGILFFVFYGIALLASFLLMNIIYVNSGLMYYDSRTDLHRQIDLSEIDVIGTNEN